MYGTRELVNQYSAQLVASVLSFVGADLRVSTFHKFLMEEWDTRVLAVYMDGELLLGLQARTHARTHGRPSCCMPPLHTALAQHVLSSVTRCWRMGARAIGQQPVPTTQEDATARLPFVGPTARVCQQFSCRGDSITSVRAPPFLPLPTAMRKVSEPARVPCCDFPNDYVPAGGRKGDSPALDIRKALWVSDKVRTAAGRRQS
jgi:hypothetical protein